MERFNLVYEINQLEDLAKNPDAIKSYDLIMAVMICSTTKQQSDKVFSNSKQYSKRYKKLDRRLRWFSDLTYEHSALLTYLSDVLSNIPSYCKTPSVSNKAEQKGNAPFLAGLVNDMSKIYNIPFNDIFNIPIDMAVWMLIVNAEREGTLTLSNDYDLDVSGIQKKFAELGVDKMSPEEFLKIDISKLNQK